jgi:hypothetical protein
MLSCTRPARGSGAPSAMLSRRSFMLTPQDLTHARGDDSDFMSRYTVVAAPQPARIVLSPFEKNWNLSIDAETRPGCPRSARGHLASRSHASGRALSRALVRSAKLSPAIRLNEPLQRPVECLALEQTASTQVKGSRLGALWNAGCWASTMELRPLTLCAGSRLKGRIRRRSRSSTFTFIPAGRPWSVWMRHRGKLWLEKFMPADVQLFAERPEFS